MKSAFNVGTTTPITTIRALPHSLNKGSHRLEDVLTENSWWHHVRISRFIGLMRKLNKVSEVDGQIQQRLDKKWSLKSTKANSVFFSEAESKKPVCWRIREENRYFSNFLCKYETHYCFKMFCGIISKYALCHQTALLKFSTFRGLFLQFLCARVYEDSNFIWTFKIKRLRYTWLPDYNLLVILYMWFCRRFVRQGRLQVNKTSICG